MKKLIGILLCVFISSCLYAETTVLEACDFSFDEVSTINLSDDGTALVWSEYEGNAKAEFDVLQDGEYNIVINYISGRGRYDDIELYFSIDGAMLSESFFSINRIYEYGPLRTDKYGDQQRALTWISENVQSERLRLKNNAENEYYSVYLEEGKHILEINARRTDFSLVSISFVPVEDSSFSTLKVEPAGEDNIIHIEAEDIYSTSSTTLTSQMDRSSADVSPSNPDAIVFNIAGGSSWNADGDMISWKIEVPSSDYYRVNLKYRQNLKKGFSVYRRILVDSYIPNEQFNMVEFPYSDSWTLNDVDGAEVYLEKGEHILTLEVIPGPYSSILSGILEIVDDLNSIYRKIVMVTSTSPDLNREYNLDREIPGLMENFNSALGKLKSAEDALQSFSGTSASYAQLSTLIEQIGSFNEEPETIPSRISTFRGNISALSSWVYQSLEQPLDLDWIELTSGDMVAAETHSSWFENLIYSFRTLIHSFDTEEDEDGEITVWVAAGRDQMEIVTALTDEYFTPETGIEVNINLVQTGIEQAILAGSGPDVVLFLGNTIPVTLAMRNALYPLSEIPEFYSVVDAYCDRASLIPYTYLDGIYGLQLTEVFPLMFYRTDVFDELGIDVPETWDEFLSIIPVIQRNNMEVGVPSAWTTFLTFLFQRGGEIYAEDKGSTVLSSNESYEAFRLYTRLFSDYGLSLSYDFFNRFRSGEMPLAIADYTEYGKLEFAAPELRGLYGVARIPKNGEHGETAVSSGQGAVILKETDDIEASWAFLKWFVSIEMQREYGNRIESLLGPSGRYSSASDEVILNLPWLPEEASLILDAREDLVQIEQIPGSYYTQRNLVSAFRRVVLDGENAREMLEHYVSIIDREIQRKRIEIGLGEER